MKTKTYPFTGKLYDTYKGIMDSRRTVSADLGDGRKIYYIVDVQIKKGESYILVVDYEEVVKNGY